VLQQVQTLTMCFYLDLSFMKTKKGNLITSGWWGRSRHPVSIHAGRRVQDR
jgi:hypothetical protein